MGFSIQNTNEWTIILFNFYPITTKILQGKNSVCSLWKREKFGQLTPADYRRSEKRTGLLEGLLSNEYCKSPKYSSMMNFYLLNICSEIDLLWSKFQAIQCNLPIGIGTRGDISVLLIYQNSLHVRILIIGTKAEVTSQPSSTILHSLSRDAKFTNPQDDHTQIRKM